MKRRMESKALLNYLQENVSLEYKDWALSDVTFFINGIDHSV